MAQTEINVQLHLVVSNITGIAAGERNPVTLAEM